MRNAIFLRSILYAIPASMDCAQGIFSFIGPVRAAMLGYDPLIAGSMIAIRALCKFGFGFSIALYLKPHNSVRILYTALVALFLTCLVGVFANNLTMLYITSGISGACSALYSSSFQVFMTTVEPSEKRPLLRVIGSFTMSWSIGMSMGPFLTGILMTMGNTAKSPVNGGWVWTYLGAAGIVTIAMLAVTFISYTIRVDNATHVRHPQRTITQHSDGQNNFAWLGWITSICGIMALGMVRGIFPAVMTQNGMPEYRLGLLMTFQTLAIAFAAFFLTKRYRWLYSGRILFILSMMGSLGLVFYALPDVLCTNSTDSLWMYWMASFLFGCFAGSVYIYSAYHSLLISSHSGKNISLNEALGAIGMTAGPLIGGWLTEAYSPGFAFLSFAIMILLLAFFQWSEHVKHTGGCFKQRHDRRLPHMGKRG